MEKVPGATATNQLAFQAVWAIVPINTRLTDMLYLVPLLPACMQASRLHLDP